MRQLQHQGPTIEQNIKNKQLEWRTTAKQLPLSILAVLLAGSVTQIPMEWYFIY